MFMIGSACFAVASLPAASGVSETAVGITYFVGSIFFTTAASEQLRVARGHGTEVWAATRSSGRAPWPSTSAPSSRCPSGSRPTTRNLLVWSPDLVGSLCFLVSSVLAAEVAVWGPLVPARRSATLNLVGSIAFGVSAVAAYVVPDTDELLNASLATSTTLVGALVLPLGRAGARRAPPWLRHAPSPSAS